MKASPSKEQRKVKWQRGKGGASFHLKPHEGINVTKSHPLHYKAFILDMDGVIHRGYKVIDGAAQFLDFARTEEYPFLLLTNECRFTNSELSAKLHDITGTKLKDSEIYTSANSVRDFFKRLYKHDFYGSVYVYGEEGIISNVKEACEHAPVNPRYGGFTPTCISGNEVIDEEIHTPVEFIVIGSVHNENTRYVETAAKYLKKGAKMVYSCPDWYDADPDGSYSFGLPMATVSLLEKSLGVEGMNLGKPNPHMIRMALSRLIHSHTTVGMNDVLFVGDSINTDIRTSIENGIDCALVMTGTTTAEKLKRSCLQPNFIFPSIKEVYECYKYDATSSYPQSPLADHGHNYSLPLGAEKEKETKDSRPSSPFPSEPLSKKPRKK